MKHHPPGTPPQTRTLLHRLREASVSCRSLQQHSRSERRRPSQERPPHAAPREWLPQATWKPTARSSASSSASSSELHVTERVAARP
eukprot:1348963-Prymnesium_polylepis.1